LQSKVSGITSDQILFIDTDPGKVGGRFLAAPGMGKEQNLPAASHKILRFADDSIGGDGDDCGVE
jgi:hypothetical protein